MKASNIKNNTAVVNHRQFVGEVVHAGNKTLSILVRTSKKHSKYKKQFFSTKKFAVHDEAGVAQVGDKVLFQECRPFSKTKKWRLLKVVK